LQVEGYSHSSAFEVLEALDTEGDGKYDQVQVARRQTESDLAVLLHEFGGGNWGAANMYPVRGPDENKAYSVVHVSHLGDNIFQHEIGHNFGTGHAEGDPDYPNNYFQFGNAKKLPNKGVHTVLSYNAGNECPGGFCHPVLYFSTPYRSYHGEKLGSEDEENNARVININGPGVSDYGVSFAGGGGGGGGGSGTGGCGVTCTSDSQCQSGFSCVDVSTTPGNECWNENQCGGGALRARIEGFVYDGCTGEPMAKVPVRAWGNTVYSNSNGRYRISKGVNASNVTLEETSILAGKDATLTNTALNKPENRFFNRDYTNLSLRGASTPSLACAIVNCLFNSKVGDSVALPNDQKLLAEGPSERYAYRLHRPGMIHDLFE